MALFEFHDLTVVLVMSVQNGTCRGIAVCKLCSFETGAVSTETNRYASALRFSNFWETSELLISIFSLSLSKWNVFLSTLKQRHYLSLYFSSSCTRSHFVFLRFVSLRESVMPTYALLSLVVYFSKPCTLRQLYLPFVVSSGFSLACQETGWKRTEIKSSRRTYSRT